MSKTAKDAATGAAKEEILQERIFQVLLRPLISEKTTAAAEKHRQIAFQVLPDAGKSEIKRAVEALFEVEVIGVQVANVRGKIKRGRTPGKRANWKKAYVRLQEGQDIDFVGMAGA
ncbi:MAG: 50S ribosomal protein L23 [Gammaproteobacteria bacterium]